LGFGTAAVCSAIAPRSSIDRAAASRIASFSVSAKPATVTSAPSTLVDASHHQARLSAVGAARRPITIRVSDSSWLPIARAG
jgi:hypothetical protein